MKKSICIILILVWGISVSNAETYKVKTNSELENIVQNLLPGDTVYLASGTWNNEKLVFYGEGTEMSPIVFAAETAGKTLFTGNTRIQIYGSFIVVKDFIFENGNLTESGSVIEFRKDSKTFANNCRLTNVSVLNYNPPSKTTDSKYVSLYGTQNRVDHCSFSGKNNSGATFVVWLDETPDYHIIDHNYFGVRPNLGVNGGETIRIGTSDWERYSSNCVVEYNLFEACDGEIEIISNKSVGNHYRYNTFDRCEGTLTLRHGSDCWVYGNFFFGDLDKECGGIRVIGPGHIVFNNYLENLSGTEYRAAICLANGVPNSPANRYRQVENAAVGFNTIVNCKEPFAIGAGKDAEKSLAPINSVIENNLVISMSNRELVKDYDSANGVSWKGIFTDAITIGITADGFTKTDLPMFQDVKLQRPTNENPGIAAAAPGAFDTIKVDIDGQIRPEIGKDVGADQQSNELRTIKPLSKNDVGANYNTSTFSQTIKKPQYNISLYNGALKVNFSVEAHRTISMFSLEGRLLSQSKIFALQYQKSVHTFPRFFIMEVRDFQSKYSVKLIQ